MAIIWRNEYTYPITKLSKGPFVVWFYGMQNLDCTSYFKQTWFKEHRKSFFFPLDLTYYHPLKVEQRESVLHHCYICALCVNHLKTKTIVFLWCIIKQLLYACYDCWCFFVLQAGLQKIKFKYYGPLRFQLPPFKL